MGIVDLYHRYDIYCFCQCDMKNLIKFAQVCSPWIFVLFIAGALAMLPRLGVYSNLSNFLEIAKTKIWNGIAAPGQENFSLWHMIFFGWF